VYEFIHSFKNINFISFEMQEHNNCTLELQTVETLKLNFLRP